MKNVSRKLCKCNKIVLALVTVLVLGLLTACSTEGSNGRYDLNVIDATSDFYVNDFAGVFSDEEKKALMDKAVAFDSETSGIQVVITTVDSLKNAVKAEEGNSSSYSIEEVAYSMYNQYAIGEDDMGILILFSTGDREVRIETGRNMQFYVTDSISGRVLDDYGMEHFKADEFAEGLIAVQSGIMSEIKENVPNDWHTSIEETTESTEAGKEEGAVSPEANENLTDNSQEKKEPSKGILWGFIGAIGALFAAIAAFFRQMFKGKSEKEEMEKAHADEITSLRNDFKEQTSNLVSQHEREMSRKKNQYEDNISEKNNEISDLMLENADAKEQIRTLTTKLEIVTDKFERIKRLHPECDFEDEILVMIENEYKAEAQRIDKELAEILKIIPDVSNYNDFNRGLTLIDSATPEVRKYITSSREEIQRLYNEAVALKKEHERQLQEARDKQAANDAYAEIKRVYNANPNGNHKTFNTLHKAVMLYLGLTAAQKAFFPDKSLISNLNKLHTNAERDHQNYEAGKSAEDEVKSIIGSMRSADEDDRDRLARAKRIYDRLSSAEAAYFSEELLRKLKKLISDADEDHRRQKRRREEEEARRRRNNSYNSMNSRSSFGGGSSFGGRGGRSGGGGASRGF